MKIKFLMTVIGLLLINVAFGQTRDRYTEYIKEAYSLYQSKDFKASAEKYKEAFEQLEGKANPNDRYNAACSYALAQDIEESFYHLYRLAESESKYNNYNHITTDPDLDILHTDPRWEKLLTIIKTNKEAYEKDFDRPLVAILDTIYQSDQGYRRQLREIEEKYGRESDEMNAHWDLIEKTDSINLIKVTKILDERGWLSSKIIGRSGNSTLFLVTQHADLETQVKYLPMMREAVQKGNASASSLALLEDRVALRQGNRQIYGSQIGRDPDTGEYYVSPLLDPENVNARRAEVGLGTIEDYIKNWDMSWDIDKHNANTEKLEAEKKEE